MGTFEHDSLMNLSVNKSTEFILSKYNSSLLEDQVMSIALARIEVTAKGDNYALEAKLYPGELKRLVSDPTHIYRDLKKLSRTIVGRTMFLEDGKGNFEALATVPNATYEDGVLTITFNNSLRKHVLELEVYTNFKLSVLTTFKRHASFRLYEVLKKEAYRIPKGGYVQVEYNLSELRFILGVADIDNPSVKRAIKEMGNRVDWDVLYNKLNKEHKKYVEWRDFKRYVLMPAQEELEERSDIRFEFEKPRANSSSSGNVTFRIFRNVPKNVGVINEREELLSKTSVRNRQYELPMDVYEDFYQEFIGHNNLAKEDLDLFLFKSGFDETLVRKSILLADEQPYISNYIGWIIKAIEKKYALAETIEVMHGSEETAKQVKAALKNYEETKEDAASAIWLKSKEKEEFKKFRDIILFEKGFTIEDLESIYTDMELATCFINYIKTGRIEL